MPAHAPSPDERAALLSKVSHVKPSEPAPSPSAADKPRFPFRPDASDTPLWRRLLLHFFDGHRGPQELLDEDVWPLDPQFHGRRAADDVVRCMPTRSRWRLLRGLWIVNRRRLLWISVWNVVCMALSVVRPLLLWHLCYIDLVGDGVLSERHFFGRDLRLVVPLVGIFAGEVALSMASAQNHVLASRMSLQVTQSLSKMIMDKMATHNQPTMMEVRKGTPPAGHKERLVQTSSLVMTDIKTISLMLSVSRGWWIFVTRLAASLFVLFSIVEITWPVISLTIAAYATATVLQVVLGHWMTPYLRSLQIGRLNVLYDSLRGIQMTKLSAWEDKVAGKIELARLKERAAWMRVSVCWLILRQTVNEIPLVVAVLAFASTAESDTASTSSEAVLTPFRVLSTLVLFCDCRFCAASIIPSVNLMLAGVHAFTRIESYVQSNSAVNIPTKKSTPAPEFSSQLYIAKMKGVCVAPTSRPTSAAAQLLDVNWTLHQGDLVVIHGPAGAGKSILLAALRGDESSARIVLGSFERLPSGCRVAYCSQDPWLQTLSIRENILFGTAFDKAKYWAVVDACGLLEDLSVLPNGDATIVGPRGINLSSGQSARIALARACYADADVYLLDCPLANVDAVVQSEIFRKCIVELLMLKTVVIVTHNPEYIGSSYVDQLVEVKSCGVGVMSRSAKTFNERQNSTRVRRTRRTRDYQASWTSKGGRTSLYIQVLPRETIEAVMRIESLSRQDLELLDGRSSHLSTTTVISKATMKEYFLGGGVASVLWLGVAVLVSIVLVATLIAKDVWIIYWATAYIHTDFSTKIADGVVWYAYLALASILLAVVYACCVFAFNAASIDALFRRTTHALVHATMSFYYQTQIGEIINRYQGDMEILDKSLLLHVKIFLVSILGFVGRAIVFGWILGPVAVSVTILGYGLLVHCISVHFYQELARATFRAQARQLNFLSEALDGEAVIRAFGSDRIVRLMEDLDFINECVCRIEHMSNLFNCHTVIKVDGAIAVLAFSLVGVLALYPVTVAELVVVLFFVFTMEEELMPGFATGLANTWEGFHNVEQLRRFQGTPVEAEMKSSMTTLTSIDLWPTCGQLTFENVDFAYADDDARVDIPSALLDVSFALRGGEKVGIVGRTGSGKSTLAMALLRVHPLRSGRILIGGVDLCSVSLAQLRRSITMIPQSPMFYRCSIRDYLDPFHEFDDAQLWRELLRVNLGGRVQNLEEELLDNGENWSLGQRQLLCFARALLKPSRVVVLDEAFSCVDQSHQEKILRILRERLASSTVVLITHRVDQILAFDRILVMRGGRLVESGSAVELASDPGSLFYEFLETSLLTQ